MIDLLSIGEILMDMTPIKIENEIYYKANEGGAPLNATVMASRMGINTMFLGKVGKDVFGERLVKLLEDENVKYDYSIFDVNKPTSLAFVQLDKFGERSFVFYREGAADIEFDKKDIFLNKEYNNIYFGSVALTKNPLRETTIYYIERAKKDGKTIFFDPNYRANLWKSEKEALNYIKMGFDLSDIIKLSEEELLFITKKDNLIDAADEIKKYKNKIVFITKGESGVDIYYKGVKKYLEAMEVKNVKDVTGAGDAFFGACIGSIIKSNDINLEVVIKAAKIGIIASGLSVSKYGAIPSYPHLNEIEVIYEKIK